jgi:hypothetical protein
MITIETKNSHINIIKNEISFGRVSPFIKYGYGRTPCYLTYYPKKDRVCLYTKRAKPLWPKSMKELLYSAKHDNYFDQFIIYILMRALCK